MAERKISYSCLLTPDQIDRLKKLKAETRVPASEIVRQGVDMIINYYERGDQ